VVDVVDEQTVHLAVHPPARPGRGQEPQHRHYAAGRSRQHGDGGAVIDAMERSV
jgi:hypothetical protein